MLQIFVPSLGRHRQVAEGPIPQMSPELRSLVRYVVPPEESLNYSVALGPLLRSGEVLECPERGIAATRRWIGEWCAEHNVEKFLMLDDDVRLVVRLNETTTKLRPGTADDWDQCLAAVSSWLDEAAHVGISARGGNNNMRVGGPRDVVDWNTRTLRALAYQTEKFLAVEHGRVEVMEDFDVNLQILRKGWDNVNLGFWAQDQKMTNAPGGCSTYRSHEVHERSAVRLTQLHDGFVRLRDKQNKTDSGGFGTRKEVTISWKKARDSARRIEP